MDASSLRTFLFIPSHRRDYLDKALRSAPDAIILDLEDGVPPDEKKRGRTVIKSLQPLPGSFPRIFVRVNPINDSNFVLDVEAVDPRTAAGIVLPRVEGAEDLEIVRQAIISRGATAGPGGLGLIALIETARGISHAAEIASVPGIVGLGFGREDFVADMGLPILNDNTTVEVSRTLLSVAAHAANRAAIDAIYPHYRDEEGLRRDSRQGAALGYTGKLCIHPAQIQVIRQTFSPDPKEIDLARKIQESSQSSGSAVFVLDGRMIDRPMVAWAERILVRAGLKHKRQDL